MTSYDIIIVGAGAAGLLLADALGNDQHFRDYRILLLEKDAHKENDRTWCFWEKGPGVFDPLLHASWDQLYFHGQDSVRRLPIAPYRYKMLRGSDFYMAYHARIEAFPNVTFRKERVVAVSEEEGGASVRTTIALYKAAWVFNSIFSWETLKMQNAYPVLQQHFVGWFVRTKKPVFDAGAATFMDFSVPQLGNTRFMYILPFSDREALVEYTLFSATLLPKEAYEQAIDTYLRETLLCDRYEVWEKEQGRIPMTCYDFTLHNSPHILHIGAAGGWAKPSTGYTFMNTFKKTKALLAFLKSGKPADTFGKKTRFWWYDLLLLDILNTHNDRGRAVFESIFKKREAPQILKFLDEETSLWEDFRIIWACPKKDFIKAFLRRLF